MYTCVYVCLAGQHYTTQPRALVEHLAIPPKSLLGAFVHDGIMTAHHRMVAVVVNTAVVAPL